jgi:hypothetical protein
MDATRILLFGGVLLIILGMTLGEVYAIFISHVVSAEIKQRLFTVVQAVGAQDVGAVHAEFDVIEPLMEKRGRIVNTHSHIIAYGFLALTLVLLQPILGLSEKRRRLFAVFLIVGALVQSLFVFASPYIGRWGTWTSDLGAVLVIAGVAGYVSGLLRPNRQVASLNALLAPLLQPRSSRLLLLGGGVLILVGMLYGFYYAWVFVTQHEVQQWTHLNATLTDAMANQHERARAAVSSYRTVQSKIAILAAAHSHAIEFGMLAILLGFVQSFVFLEDRWRVRWAWVFLIGSFLLPVFVFNATVFGLVSAGFADLSGFTALVALCAMMVGVIRYTGMRDFRQAHGDE